MSARERFDRLIAALPEDLPVAEQQVQAAEAMLARDPLRTERAYRVLICPLPRDPRWHDGFVRMPCHLRGCPACAERRAARLAADIVERASGYEQPTAILITCPSRSLLDLAASVRLLRASLGKLRMRRWFRSRVPAGVVAIETPLTEDGRRWATHAHGVVDARLGTLLDAAAFGSRLSVEWAGLTGISGALCELEMLRDGAALAGYSLKLGREKSWCPDPSALSPRLRAHLDQALRGRRLLSAWGQRRIVGHEEAE